MFGEPGDGFHDAYVEANYAYRVALKHCHSLVRLEPNCEGATGCNAAFYHIGGGRGTRPNRQRDIRAPDFYGTPAYAHVKKQLHGKKTESHEAPSWEQQRQWQRE